MNLTLEVPDICDYLLAIIFRNGIITNCGWSNQMLIWYWFRTRSDYLRSFRSLWVTRSEVLVSVTHCVHTVIFWNADLTYNFPVRPLDRHSFSETATRCSQKRHSDTPEAFCSSVYNQVDAGHQSLTFLLLPDWNFSLERETVSGTCSSLSCSFVNFYRQLLRKSWVKRVLVPYVCRCWLTHLFCMKNGSEIKSDRVLLK